MTDATHAPLNLLPDAPIDSSNLDRLDRMSFVRSFAEAIRAVKGTDSVVLALAGPWGSGKSSLLNLIHQELERREADNPPLVMKFNPWWFSGTEQLVAAFLQQLGAAISRPEVKDTLGRASQALDRLAYAIANPGSHGGEADPASRDIQMIRHDIDTIFRESSRRILIMMDDIDRLTPQEMSQLLLIVRAVADLPNTTYVLSFDYEVVVQAIGEKLGVDGRTYLEKVVQLQIDVPLPGKMTLERMVVGQLAAIDPSANALDQEAQRNFRVLFEGGVKHFLATPRACTRLLNVLRFTYPTLTGQVYFPDLLGICCLMSFSSQSIQAIRSYSEAFVGPCDYKGRGWVSLREFHSRWINQIPKRDRAAVESITRQLFPKFAWALNGPVRGEEYAKVWDEQKRICSVKHYDAYFRLGITAGEALERQWRNMIGLLDDATTFAQALQRFGPLDEEAQGADRVGELLRRAVDFVNEQATSDQARQLFRAIMRRGDQIAAVRDEENDQRLKGDPVHWVAAVLLDCLQRIEDPAERLETLIRSVKEDAGLLTSAELLELLDYRIDVFAVPTETPTAEANKAKLLKVLKILDARIKKSAESGELAEHPLFMRVAQKWRMFGRKAKPRHWVQETCAADERFVEAIVQVCTGSDWAGDSEERALERLPVDLLIDLFEGDEVVTRTVRILKERPEWLNSDDEKILRMLVKRMVAMKSNS